MGLKLRVMKGDRIVLSDGVQIAVNSIGKVAELEFTAPKEIEIHTIFKDPEKQFKNLRKEDLAKALQASAKAMQPSPEEQREAKERELRGDY